MEMQRLQEASAAIIYMTKGCGTVVLHQGEMLKKVEADTGDLIGCSRTDKLLPRAGKSESLAP